MGKIAKALAKMKLKQADRNLVVPLSSNADNK